MKKMESICKENIDCYILQFLHAFIVWSYLLPEDNYNIYLNLCTFPQLL